MMDANAADPRLGRMMKEYKASASATRSLILIALGCAGIGALLLAAAGSELRSSRPEWGGAVILSILGLAFLSVASLIAYLQFLGRAARVCIHENGLSFRRGGKSSTTTWDEVESLVVGMFARIVTTDGEVIDLGAGIEGIDEVIERIHDETLSRILPRVRAAIDKGASVEFKGWKPGG